MINFLEEVCAQIDVPDARSVDTRKEVKRLVAQNKIKQSIDVALEFAEKTENPLESTLILISGQYHDLETKDLQGLLTMEQSTVEANKIAHRMIKISKQL